MKDLNYYLGLPYTVSFHPDEEGEIRARVEELPGCEADGPTVPEALENLEELKKAWIEDAIQSGQSVPEPVAEEELPSGKWVQRVPRSLHLKLSRAAKSEGVSLNSFVTSLLAEAVGSRIAAPVEAVQHLTTKAAGREMADAWDQVNPGWADEPPFGEAVVAFHECRQNQPRMALAEALQLILTGHPKSKTLTKGLFNAEKRKQTF